MGGRKCNMHFVTICTPQKFKNSLGTIFLGKLITVVEMWLKRKRAWLEIDRRDSFHEFIFRNPSTILS